MAILMEDTDLAAERQLVRLWARNSPANQWSRWLALWEFGKQLQGGSPPLVTPLATTLLVLTELKRLRIPYCIGGSLASSLYGEVRFTQDTDVLAAMTIQHVAPLVEALENDFYISSEAAIQAVRGRSCFNLIHFSSQHKIDIFVSPQRTFDHIRLERSFRPEGFPELFLVSTPEDTVLAKLEWNQLSASQRQWRDVLGVLASQGERIDLAYLRHWAKELKVEQDLELALHQIQPLID